MVTTDFNEIAYNREMYASSVTDQEIWRSVVLNVIQLDIDYQMKVDILIQSIPDIGIIFGQLKYYNRHGMLSNKEYYNILSTAINKYHINEEPNINFNPLEYSEH